MGDFGAEELRIASFTHAKHVSRSLLVRDIRRSKGASFV